MKLPENYVVICTTREETNEVISFKEPYNTKNWQFWDYVTISTNEWNIYSTKENSKRWFKDKDVSDYKTFTFKEWKEMKEDKTPPEYWFIKITEKTLDTINKVRAKQQENNEPIKLNDYVYYGKSKEYLNFGGLGVDTVKEENLLELSLEEFKSYFLQEEKEFVFPEKWAILATKENFKEISDFYCKNTKLDTYDCNTWIDYYFHSHDLSEHNHITKHTYPNYCYRNIQEGYSEITFDQFKEHVLNQKSKPMQKLTISVTELLEIHIIACSSWKTKIAHYLTRVDSNQNITFTQSEVDEMFKAATSDQKPVLTKIFGEQIKPIEWDKIKTGSKVMIKNTDAICSGNWDKNKPVDVVFYKTKQLITGGNIFKKESVSDKYCTFYQDSNFILFSADISTNYITEVIEY